MNSIRALPFLVVCLILLAGCNLSPSWLQGKWAIDLDRTKDMAKNEATENAKGNSMQSAANAMGVMWLPALKDSTVTITGKDIITDINNQEKYVTYEVMSQTASQVDVKKSDGTIQHFYRDGDEIYTYAPGNLTFKFYLKRMQ